MINFKDRRWIELPQDRAKCRVLVSVKPPGLNPNYIILKQFITAFFKILLYSYSQIIIGSFITSFKDAN